MNNKVRVMNSLNTILEMLKDRQIDITGITIQQFEPFIDANYNKQLFSLKINNISIVYYLPVKFKKSDLMNKLAKEESDLTILVLKDKLSQSNSKEIAGFKNIQVFDIKELQYNVTKHVLVPKHELITNEDYVKSIVAGYALKNKFQLPHILKTDPISRYLGLKSGDVVKITRISPTAGEYIIYRCCL